MRCVDIMACAKRKPFSSEKDKRLIEKVKEYLTRGVVETGRGGAKSSSGNIMI